MFSLEKNCLGLRSGGCTKRVLLKLYKKCGLNLVRLPIAWMCGKSGLGLLEDLLEAGQLMRLLV